MKKKVFLTAEQKRKLAREVAAGRLTVAEAAVKFNVSKSAASKIAVAYAPTEEIDVAAEMVKLGALIEQARKLAEELGYTVKLERL